MAVCIGMDAHARTCTYKAKDEEGKLLDERTIPSDREALNELATRFPASTVVLEASSVHEWIYDPLTERKLTVFPVHPQNNRRATGKKRDDIDAGFLVDAYRLGVLNPAYVPTKPIRELRQPGRHRAYLIRQSTRYRNRILGILKRNGIKIKDPDTDLDASNIFTKRMRTSLLSIGDREIPILLDLHDEIRRRIRATDEEIEQTVESNNDMKNLTTIPGIGKTVALIIYAEAGDVTRFKNAEAFSAYFGLVPNESQSGDTLHRGHITKHGSSLARWALSQAAWRHINNAPDSFITKKYRNIATRAGKKRASIAVARMLSKISYRILKEKRSWYD